MIFSQTQLVLGQFEGEEAISELILTFFCEKNDFFANLHFWLIFYSKFCTILKGLLRASEGVPRGPSEKFFKLNFTRYHIEKTIGGIPNKHVWAPRSQIS